MSVNLNQSQKFKVAKVIDAMKAQGMSGKMTKIRAMAEIEKQIGLPMSEHVMLRIIKDAEIDFTFKQKRRSGIANKDNSWTDRVRVVAQQVHLICQALDVEELEDFTLIRQGKQPNEKVQGALFENMEG